MIVFLRTVVIEIDQFGKCIHYVTVLDFIGNSYKRSVQIALALGSLAQNLVLEKRLMMALVQDDFSALGLDEYGVEIHIDDLSKEEIIEYLEQENFNSLSYMKQDYENFRKYIGSQDPPKHMDYLNNDCAPDLQRFMNIRIGGKKTGCYYEFLTGIGEENLPVFMAEQVSFLKYVSGLLPLVRPHEYLILKALVDAVCTYEELYRYCEQQALHFTGEQLDHALKYMLESRAVSLEQGRYSLSVTMDDQFHEHLEDLLDYGLTKYNADYQEETGFLLWHSYSMDGVQRKLLKNPGYNQLGTYVYGKVVVIFLPISNLFSTIATIHLAHPLGSIFRDINHDWIVSL